MSKYFDIGVVRLF